MLDFNTVDKIIAEGHRRYRLRNYVLFMQIVAGLQREREVAIVNMWSDWSSGLWYKSQM